ARAERRMRAITRAYATLSDPLLRREYDLRRPWTAEDEAAARREEASGDGPHDGYIPHDPRDPFTPMHHVLGTRPLRVETGYGVYDHASRNPNGTGQFFGLLGLIVGLAVFLGAVNGGPSSSAPLIIVGVIAVIGLVVLAGFFLPGTPLARAATTWMEGEPRGFTPRPRTVRRTASTATKPTAPHNPPPDSPAGDAQDSTATGEISQQAFEELVDEAVASLPDEFYAFMENVLVRVEQKPDAETLRKMQVPPGGLLLGLYTGVPLTHQTGAGNGPEVITIYRGPITHICRNDPKRIRAQVRATVLHELAHHFGIDHDEMPEWVK
ncbi:MAG: metallopeptidase family protein, partial [Ktedonobacterales bacterium]